MLSGKKKLALTFDHQSKVALHGPNYLHTRVE